MKQSFEADPQALCHPRPEQPAKRSEHLVDRLRHFVPLPFSLERDVSMVKQCSFCLVILAIPIGVFARQPPQNKPPIPKIGLFRATPTVSLYSAFYLNDRGLHKELGLKPEQVKQLAPLVASSLEKMNEGGWDRTRRDKVDRQTTAALAGVLTPEQQRRLRQVTLQQLVRLRTGPLTLAEDVGVGEALQWTADQKKELGQRKRPAEVLTDEQKKIWETLLGKPYPARLHARNVKNANSIKPYETLFPLLGILLSVPFEEELNLTGEQLRRLAVILEGWYDFFPDCNYSELNAAEKELLAACETVLTEKQRLRYRQVLHRLHLQGLQLFIPGIGATDVVLYQPLVEAWKLTGSQKKQREELLQAYLDGIRKLAESDIPFRDLPGHGGKLWARTAGQLEALLTAEQKTVTAEMLGEPLGPSFHSPFYRPARPEATRLPLPKSYLARNVLASAFSPLFPDNLKVTEEQKKQLRDLAVQFVPQPSVRDEFVPEPDDDTRKANADGLARGLATILKPEQLQLARQFAFRQLLSGLDTYLPIEVLNTDELIEPLGLSAAQKARLYRGAIFGKVLQPAQLELVKKLTGPALQAPKRPVVLSPTTPRPAADDYSISAMYGSVRLMQMRLIGHYAIQNELKLTAEQRKAIAELATRSAGTLPKRGGDRAAFRQQAEKHAETYYGPVSKLLTEAQNKRWRQLAYQRYDAGARGLAGLLEVRVVQDALKLTSEQVKRVTAHPGMEATLVMQFLNDAAFKVRSRTGPPARLLSYSDMRPIMEARLGRMLTREQQTALKELLGEEMKSSGYLPPGSAFAPQPY
ncbi:MAG: hypothetical protein U0736_07530 [Gemmataceae bacterium]